MPVIEFTSNLKRFFPDLKTQHSKGKDLMTIIEDLDNQFPGIKDYIIDEKKHIRQHVNIFIGNELAHKESVLQKKLGMDDQVYIMQALSGG